MNNLLTRVPPVSEQTRTAVRIGQYLLLSGTFIDVTTRDDQILIFGAYLKLIAIGLFIYASFREAREQQIAPGVTTAANRMKIIGSLITLIAALTLTAALLRESVTRRATGLVQPSISPAVGGTGAFLS